jgi:CTP:molybdopterin cytidylyltransferase MocA
LRAVIEHCADFPFDYFLCNLTPISASQKEKYLAERAVQIDIDIEEIARLGALVVCKDLLAADHDKVRHDPLKLSQAIFELVLSQTEPGVSIQPPSKPSRESLMRKLTLLILAAGKGTRLKSTLPKVLHQLAGKSLIEHVVEAAGPLNPSATCVVVGYEAARVESTLSHRSFQFAVQEPQLGTGHAVQVAGAFWKPNEGDLLVLSGDVPLISTQTLQRLLNQHTQSNASVTLLSTKLEDPAGYGRVARSADGDVERIVEHKDATDEERRISEINTGIYCFVIADLAQVIDQLSAENSQREYYLT